MLFRILCQFHQILPIIVFQHGLGQLVKLLFGNPAALECNFFKAGHLQSLALFNDLYESGGFR